MNFHTESFESSPKKVYYADYTMNYKQKLFAFLQAALVLYGVGYIFYHNFLISLLLLPLASFYPQIKKKHILEQRQRRLRLECKEFLYSIQSSLHAGKSAEAALFDVPKDIQMFYPSESAEIIQEVLLILRKLDFNIPLEDSLDDFAKRTGLSDIENFAESLRICKRHGGNLIQVSQNTIHAITQKLEIEEDIEVILAQKKWEQTFLFILPIGMILLLSVIAKDYFEVLFEGKGHIIMTVVMMLIATAYWLSSKLSRIQL